MLAMKLNRGRAWFGKESWRVRGFTRRRVLLVALITIAALQGWSGPGAGSVSAQGGCQTPFLV